MAVLDPITFQILRHKFSQVTAEAIAALKNVSGTANTNVAHDMMVSLYGIDGSLTVGGAGYVDAMPTGAQSVKHLIEYFSDDPGIFEGDAYFFNDPYSGALHAPDVFIVSPIHFDGELTGFVANFVHVTDIGGMDSGGFCPNALESYQEGFMSKGLKIVEQGKLRRDVMDSFLNMVRDPDMTALDLKSQLAANHVAKERMLKLYGDYGRETVDAVARQLMDQSERLFRERLRELPDGTWRACEYVDIDGAECKVELTAIKEADTLTYDFSGSSPQVKFGINCSYWATWGAMFAPIFPLLAWDIMWNEGITRPVEMIAPEGSVVNCTHPAPLSIATVGMILSVNNVSNTVVAKMLGTSETYKDRVTGIWRGTGTRLQLHGYDDEGRYFSTVLTDTWCGSGGATPFKDGEHAAGEIPNVVSAMANVETHELNTPILYLYRRLVPNSVGAGKFRGGMSHEYAFTPHGFAGSGVAIVAKGKGCKAPISIGIFGGYPGCNVHYYTFRNSNAMELPYDLASTSGEKRQELSWGPFELAGGDMQYVCAPGGGGYGDPLDREPASVLRDLSLGIICRDVAEAVYGVALTADGKSVDPVSTDERRSRIRRERGSAAEDEKPISRRVVPSTGMRISEYLQSTRDGAVQCTWCGHVVAPTAEWKANAIIRRSAVGLLGPMHATDGHFHMVEAICSGCGTVLDVDVSSGDDPVRQDLVRRW